MTFTNYAELRDIPVEQRPPSPNKQRDFWAQGTIVKNVKHGNLGNNTFSFSSPAKCNHQICLISKFQKLEILSMSCHVMTMCSGSRTGRRISSQEIGLKQISRTQRGENMSHFKLLLPCFESVSNQNFVNKYTKARFCKN